MCMSFLVLLIFSGLTLWRLPFSLLPSIEIPQIIIKVTAPEQAPEVIEQEILRLIREQMSTLKNLESVESEAQSESGVVTLNFSFNTDMKLAYIEINEKIDRLTENLPTDLLRPQVIKINTTDIPVVRLQVIPKQEVENLIELSELTERVLKKRLEALNGVSLVDLNGLQRKAITVEPNLDKLQSLGISENNLRQAIRQSNQSLGAVSIKDGQYRYYLNLSVTLRDVSDVTNIPIVLGDNKVINLGDLATVKETTTKNFSWHFFNQQAGILITLHKQADAQMDALMQDIEQSVQQFQNDYPSILFHLTQNQSHLLNVSIRNLQSSLLYGGLFAFSVLFLFIGNYRIPFIIGISVPTSLLLSFLFFYILGLSINIISLSGMALGTGMLIDNAIIVLDNITQKWQQNKKKSNALFMACVNGTKEVISPLVSSVLTTLAVFVPLIFLSGLSGALFYDQAVAVGATLGSSLLVSFFLLPLCYWLFFRKKHWITKGEKGLEKQIADSHFFLRLLEYYKTLHDLVFKFKNPVFVIIILLGGIGIWFFQNIEKANLPKIEKQELVLQIDWNEPIEIDENKHRILKLIQNFEKQIILVESDIGLKQLLIQNEKLGTTEAEVYFLCASQPKKEKLQKQLKDYLSQTFPQARSEFRDAQNAFNQIFGSNQPFLEARLANLTQHQPLSHEIIQDILPSISSTPLKLGKGWQENTQVLLKVDTDKINTLGLSYELIIQKLEQLFGNTTITEIKNFGEVIPIQIRQEIVDFDSQFRKAFVVHNSENASGEKINISYPLQAFIEYQFNTSYKSITASELGIYQPIIWYDNTLDAETLITELQIKAKESNLFNVTFLGEYFTQKETFSQMAFILLVSTLLLFFILAAQFESLLQPLIILFTLPLGVSGSLLFLWFADESLNIMSVIGIVVMLGIMVNDAILKIDTMNRLWKKAAKKSTQELKEVILRAGSIRLKPILMTSITTILALTPIIFSSGLGSDLQRPLAIALIGGMTVGTFTALFFIPLLFYFFTKKAYNVPLC